MFGEQRSQLAQLHVDLGQPRFSGRVQSCSVPAEIVDGLPQETAPGSGEIRSLRSGRVALDRRPEPLMQQDVGLKLAHCWLDSVEGGSQLRVGRYRLQVPHHGHGVFQALRNGLESQHRVFEGSRTGVGGQAFQLLSRIA